MTPFEKFIQSLTLTTFDPWFFIKLLFLAALSIYVAFAVVVVRQVAMMSRTVKGSLNWLLKLITWIHFGVAVGVFVLALIVL